MPKDIKTHEIVKDIKMFDKKSIMQDSLRDASIRTKDAVQGSAEPEASVVHHNNPEGYATDKVERYGKEASVKTAQHGTQTAGHATKATAKTTGRAAKTTIKTAKTSTQAAKATAKSAQAAAKASAKAAQAARISTKVATTVAKAAVKATTAFVKAAIAAAKSLVAAIAAGGGVAVAIIVILCLVALIAASAFGIFFTGGATDENNPSLREVIATINTEQADEINQIKANNSHDEVILTGSTAPWKEVLAVFSVRTTTDSDNPLDILTMDEQRQTLLRQVHGDMSAISYRMQDREAQQATVTDDGAGNLVEDIQTVTIHTLYIELSALSADEAAQHYGFTAKQTTLLHDLLDPQYDSTWQSVLYGIHAGSGDIVKVAASQIGNVGGQPYWSWYGFGSRVEWCACFVSWCANECGYIEAGVIPKFAACQSQGIPWFKDRGQWADPGYTPQPGDIIFFDWGSDGISDHVGIVESCDGITVRTIEGNSGDTCARRTYNINNPSICGYGLPRWN